MTVLIFIALVVALWLKVVSLAFGLAMRAVAVVAILYLVSGGVMLGALSLVAWRAAQWVQP